MASKPDVATPPSHHQWLPFHMKGILSPDAACISPAAPPLNATHPSDRPSTTSSSGSCTAQEFQEFLNDVQTVLRDEYGAAGMVTRKELRLALAGMGLEPSEATINGLWEELAPSHDATLPIHEVLKGIGQKLLVRTPKECELSSTGLDLDQTMQCAAASYDSLPATPMGRDHFASDVKRRPGSVLWWGYQPLADTM
eukprot:Sspe_Gene.6987::Locus_2339_Transcript_1_1_Confidence_1.000_Length_738::g.6987::m.6987